MINEILCFLENNAPLIISACALGLTIQQSLSTRRHNRLSVQPRLATAVNEETITNQPNQPKVNLFKYTLFNNGLGPAVIEDFKFLIDGIPIEASQPKDVFKAIQKASELKFIDNPWTITLLKKEHVMGKDTSELITQLAFIQDDQKPFEKDRYHVLIKYKSAYGEPFTYDSRDHD